MGIKVLFKNTLNDFKKKKIQLLAIGIIIALSSFLYTTMFYALDGLKKPLESFMKETNQEDFSINMINGVTEFDIKKLSIEKQREIQDVASYRLTDIKKYNEDIYNEIINNRINEFNKEYDGYNLEVREYREVNFDKNGISNKVTFFKENKAINLSYIEEGHSPKANNEIAITRIYAKNNNLKIGDKIKIGENTYSISGFVLLPDNTLPMTSENFIIDNSKITIAIVNDDEYEKIKGKEDFYICGEFEDKNSINDDYDNDLEFITNITLTKNQIRSGAIYEEIIAGKAMTMGISLTISTIAVLIVLILTYKIVQNQKTQIGVLKALGYSKKEILSPYIILLLIISLPMLLIGYIAGIYASEPMRSFYLEFYLIPKGQTITNFGVLLVAILIPLLIILGLSTIIINKMLSKNSVSLMKVSNKEKVSKINKLLSKLLKKSKPQTKFKYSFIFANTSKFIVFFIGIVFSSMLIIMSLMMVNFFDKMALDYYNSVDYKYEAYIDLSKEIPSLKQDEEKFISLPNVMYEDENINLVGIESNNKLHRIFNKHNKDITRELAQGGVIVNSSFAMTYNVDAGDKINVKIENEMHELEVIDISKDYGASKVYVNRSKLSNIISDNGDFYNGIYSKNKVDESKYLSVTNKEDILEQSMMMQEFIKIAIYSMIISAVAIAIIVLYVLTTMTIEDNYYSISLLKVMGYSKKEVNSMILKSYLVYSIVSYLISIPITVFGFGYGMKYLAREFGMVIPFEFNIWYGIMGLLLIEAIFILGSYSAKKKIEKVSLQEVLKEYRD
ncbi:FtsX-like permease family protein [Paraclostridium ghonii]|uniref:ABC transport system permease protein n=1 Tax=Paraclostridium ghonii TaxID=29358 RepID=A0ABU0MZN5_9FIRM|nr:ABC transporter permease [Paeniclostridium ghonii]MDQ0556331.1 putative ABC transport system permease protein [Paeniclostridium ghonii]